MANVIQIKVTGLSDLDRQLRAFGPKLAERGLRAMNYAGAKVILDAARAAAPVRTGLLRANIVTIKRRSPRNAFTHSVALKSVRLTYGNTKLNKKLRRVGKKYTADGPAFYGKFIEFGSSKMEARPFLRPAFYNAVPAAVEAMKARLAKAVEDAAKR